MRVLFDKIGKAYIVRLRNVKKGRGCRMSSLNSFNILESVEELRSSLTLIGSDFAHLTRVIESESRKYLDRKQFPPISYLEHFASQIKININKIKEQCDDLRRTLDSGNTLEALRLIHYVQYMIHELNSNMSFLENFVNQRLSGTATPLEFTHYSPSIPFEITTMQKIFIAADCVCLNLFDNILGQEWLQREKCVPSSFFGEGYRISTVNYITQIPLSDKYRGRFWPIIAHEAAHVKIVELIRQGNEPFLQILFDISNALQQWPLEINSSNSKRQTIELFCDLIGTHICGPSFANASAESLRPELPLKENSSSPSEPFILGEASSLMWAFRNLYTHPPNDVRISLILKMLEYENIKEAWLYSLKDFINQKNEACSSSYSLFKLNTFLRIYENVVSDRFDEIFGFIQGIFPAGYTKEKWENTKEQWKKTEFCGHWITNPTGVAKSMSPIDLLNLIWLDRKASFDNIKSPNLWKLFDKRKKETKLFPYVVKSLCSHHSICNVHKNDNPKVG